MLHHEFGRMCRGRRIHRSGHSDLEVGAIWSVLRLLLVLHNQAVLQWHPLLWRPSFVMQTNLALWIQHTSLNRLSLCYLGLCTFDTAVPTPHFFFLRWQMSISAAKWTVLCSICASRIFQWIASIDFAFSDGSRNFRKLLCVCWEVFVLHG